MDNDKILQNFRASLVAGGRSKGTISVRLSHVQKFLDSICIESLREVKQEDIENFLAKSSWNVQTKRSVLSSLKVFFKWCVSTRKVKINPTEYVEKVLLPRSLPRPASEEIITSALAAAPRRVQLLIELMAFCGLRRAEAAAIHRKDFIFSEELNMWLIRVKGKGNHERIIPAPAYVAYCMKKTTGYLFPNGKGSHISPAHAGKLVSKYLPSGVTPHMLRHRFATQAYARSQNIRAVQELLGHAKLETTSIYVKVSSQEVALTAAKTWKLA